MTKGISKYLTLVAVVVVLVGLGYSYFKKSQKPSTKDKLTVQAGWIVNGEFANVCSAILQGYYDKENLDVKILPGGPSGANFIVATTAVAQDSSLDIGIDGDIVPLVKGVSKQNSNEQLKMKAFASFWTDEPFGFMVRTSSGINSLKGLGKRKVDGSKIKIGVTADFVLQDALAKYAGVNTKDLNFVTVGFDATPLISNQVDALAGYWTTQAYELEKANIPYKFLPISELPGFQQPSQVAVATDATIANKKDQLVRWLKATIKGSQFVEQNPEQAAKDIMDSRCGGPSLDLTQETWLIKKALSLYNSNGIGKLDISMMQNFAQAYYKLGQIPVLPSINSYTDTSILNAVYSK